MPDGHNDLQHDGLRLAARTFDRRLINVELRSVNHRYLDLQFRLPEELRSARAGAARGVRQRSSAARSSAAVGSTRSPGRKHAELNVDSWPSCWTTRAVRKLLAGPAARAPRRRTSCAGPACWAPIPGVDAVRAVSRARGSARRIHGRRAREGEKLKAILLERVATMERTRRRRAAHARSAGGVSEKLAKRLNEALANADDERIRQEIMLFANKIDVDEELSRLTAHFSEIAASSTKAARSASGSTS